jgi:hypothetical protein
MCSAAEFPKAQFESKSPSERSGRGVKFWEAGALMKSDEVRGDVKSRNDGFDVVAASDRASSWSGCLTSGSIFNS